MSFALHVLKILTDVPKFWKSSAPRHACYPHNKWPWHVPLFGVMLQKIICTDISHSGNFIVEKLINCCVFHSNFFFYEQHLNHEETWPGYASHCETEDSLLLQRFFGHWSSLFVVFFCLKDFRDDFCCSLSERIGAEFYSL